MRSGQTTLVFDECLVYVCQHISQIYSSCTVVCREAGNERWQNVITPAAAGSFYFRLPSGKDTTHLPVVKTQPPHSQSPGWCEQKPHDEIYYMRSPAVDTRRRPAGGSQFFIGVNTPILFFLMILVRVLTNTQGIPGCWRNSQFGDRHSQTSAVVHTENDCDQTPLN